MYLKDVHCSFGMKHPGDGRLTLHHEVLEILQVSDVPYLDNCRLIN